MFHQAHRTTSNKDEQEQIILAFPSLSEPKKTHPDDHGNNDDTQFEQHVLLKLPTDRPSIPVHAGITEESTANMKKSMSQQPSAELSGREKLKKHRNEVAGRVWIPDLWGQEKLLKEWIDCSTFDSSLFPTGLMSARDALVQEGRRANSGRLKI